MTNDKLMRADEVAAWLDVPATWVYAAVRAGNFPAVHVGRHVRFQRHEVEAWIAAGGKPAE